MNKLTRWKYKLIEVSPWFIAAVTALSSHWAAHAVEESIDAFAEHGGVEISYLRIFYIVFFVIMLIVLIKVRTAFFRPRTRYMRGEKPEKREHLIIFLSHLFSTGPSNNGIPEGITVEGDFEKDFLGFVQYKENKKNKL